MKEMRQKVIDECTLKESAAINQILGRKVSTEHRRYVLKWRACVVWYGLFRQMLEAERLKRNAVDGFSRVTDLVSFQSRKFRNLLPCLFQ